MAFYTKYKELLFNKNKEGVKELFENADTTEAGFNNFLSHAFELSKLNIVIFLCQ